MSSFLFAMFDGGGNLPLIAPVVRAMVARGHHVTVIAGPNIRRPDPPPTPLTRFLEHLTPTGAQIVPLLDAPLDPHDGYEIGSAFFRRTPSTLWGAVDAGRIARWAHPWAERLSSVIDQTSPDAVVSDFFLFGALAAAERSGVPSAALVHNCTPTWPLPGMPLPTPGSQQRRGPAGWIRDRVWAGAFRHVARREAAASVNAARRTVGLGPVDDPYEQIMRADRVLVMGTEAFELPRRKPMPSNVRYVGVIAHPDPTATWDRAPPGEGPVILVTLSTLAQGQVPVMRNVLKAVGSLPIRAVVTLGPALARESFDSSSNIQLETFVPHEAILPHVDAVVTQCGLSTISKVLARGLPMVCLPVLGDQPANAARIDALGAGIRLAHDASPALIRTAIRRVLEESRFRLAAERYARTERRDPRELVVAELESLTGN